jgi:hypothetical protein
MPKPTTGSQRQHQTSSASRASRGARPHATSDAAVNLKLAMRKLWTDHVTWTHTYVVAVMSGPHGITDVAEHLPVGRMGSTVATAAQKTLKAMPMSDADATAARLLHNQEEIGDAVAAYYGKDAGKKLTKLLKEHIMIAVELCAAAKAKDDKAVEKQNKVWVKNADEIATFLGGANPNWPEATVKDLLHLHLELTAKEAIAYRDHKWNDAIQFVDDIYTEIYTLADALADGIVKQFPDRF